MIAENRKLFNAERGKKDAKQDSLSNVGTTIVEMPGILNIPFEKIKPEVSDEICGNVKALIPLKRQRFNLEYDDDNTCKARYKKEEPFFLQEKRIFGVMTRHQVGYNPPLKVCYTEEGDDCKFIVDTYIFKSLRATDMKTNFLPHEENRRLEQYDFNKCYLEDDSRNQEIRIKSEQLVKIFH